MGREANCVCEWNGETARVKALLESGELILRGEIRRRIRFSEIKQLSTAGGALTFKTGADRVRLDLGQELTSKWAKLIVTPPPSLAKKFGIAAGSRVRLIGVVDDDALSAALAEAEATAQGDADLIVARADTPAELKATFKKAGKLLTGNVPIWIVYPKGAGHAIGETSVRTAGLAAGVVDVKVASVSPRLTALKFVMRKAQSAR